MEYCPSRLVLCQRQINTRLKKSAVGAGGLGVGGIGLSKIEAKGEVYGLQRLRDFPGACVQGRYGFAVGNTSAGDLWLQNGNGVIMRLVAKRQGLMLSLGGDAVVIQMNQ